MIYSLNVEAFKFHPYDIANINKAIERFGISVIDKMDIIPWSVMIRI